ncbi:hypothetical protein KKC00_01210 [Patescibacteria group bacterium]|nr:hypothetical protein [Patescibacteria group bacterium]
MKINKSFSIILLIFFLFSFGFICFAQTLEIDYPHIPNEDVLSTRPSIPQYFKYLFSLGMWLGFAAAFISLVIAGIFYLISPAKPAFKAKAKDRLSGAVLGLVFLLIIYAVVTTINPELKFFRDLGMENIPEQTLKPVVSSGVYFYYKQNCSEQDSKEKVLPYIYSVDSFNQSRNKIESAKIVHDFEREFFYIAILYDLDNFQGKCKYINPTVECESMPAFADSASIYRYSHNPSGNGVWFYRKSFYDESGGWYKVDNDKIKNTYVGDLEELEFNDVPEEDKICAKWNPAGECDKTTPPNLAEGNISSILIDGDYFVLLVYFDPKKDTKEGPWSFCQAFPTIDDINKEGPKQIKWEYIMEQTNGNLPNFVIIFPVEKK